MIFLWVQRLECFQSLWSNPRILFYSYPNSSQTHTYSYSKYESKIFIIFRCLHTNCTHGGFRNVLESLLNFSCRHIHLFIYLPQQNRIILQICHEINIFSAKFHKRRCYSNNLYRIGGSRGVFGYRTCIP